MPGVSKRRAAAPGKRGARRLGEKHRQAAALMGQGVVGVDALEQAGLKRRRGTVSDITASAEGQAIIQSERQKRRDLFRRAVDGGLFELLGALYPEEFELPGRGPRGGKRKKSTFSRKEAATLALKREILQTAELLGPEHVHHSGKLAHEHSRRVRLEDLTDEELATLEAIKDRLPEQGAGDEGPSDEGGDPDGEGET